MLNFKDFLNIKEAAQFIGVTPNTMRNWEKEKRITTYARPFDKRRLYKKEDLENYLTLIQER